MHMLNYLCRHGVVTPSATTAPGRGRVRRYTYCDLILLRVVAKLLDQGISVLRFRKQCCLLKSRELNLRRLSACRYLVTDGSNVYFKNDRALERMDSGQMAFAFVLDMKPVRSEVSNGLRRGSRVA